MKQVAMLFVTCALIFFADFSSAKYLLVEIDDGYNGKIYYSCQLKKQTRWKYSLPCHPLPSIKTNSIFRYNIRYWCTLQRWNVSMYIFQPKQPPMYINEQDMRRQDWLCGWQWWRSPFMWLFSAWWAGQFLFICSVIHYKIMMISPLFQISISF